MKNVFGKILIPVLLFSLTACGGGNNKKAKVSLTDPVVTEQQANKIKEVYTSMVQDYSSTNKQGNLKQNKTKIYPLNTFSEEADGDLRVNEETTSNLDRLCENFVNLKDLAIEDFANYCDQFNPLKLDGITYNAKVSIYEETEQFALILQYKNVYIFFSNFYFDADLNKHFEKLDESYEFSFNATILVFSVDENKISFPMIVGDLSNAGGMAITNDAFIINNENELEDADMRCAYDSIKYPFVEHLFSDEILALLHSDSRSIEHHKDFIELTEKQIYLSNKTGKFDRGGLNYRGELIDYSLDSNKINISNDYYNITTYSPQIFLMKRMVLTVRITESHFRRTLTKASENKHYDYDEEIKYVEKTYVLSTEVETTETGVRFKLNKELDLEKPNFVDDSGEFNPPNPVSFPEEQPLTGFTINFEYLNENISLSYLNAGEYIPIVSLPNIR